MHTQFSPIIVVSRQEVESGDTSSVLTSLQSLITSPQRAASLFEKVDLAFHGYDDTDEELFEIDKVRDYVRNLDEKFPFWLYFLNKTATGLQCIAYCFMPLFLTPEGKQLHFPDRLNDLLTKRWFPAMNQICEWTGFTEEQIEVLTDRSVEYLLAGPSDAS